MVCEKRLYLGDGAFFADRSATRTYESALVQRILLGYQVGNFRVACFSYVLRRISVFASHIRVSETYAHVLIAIGIISSTA